MYMTPELRITRHYNIFGRVRGTKCRGSKCPVLSAAN